MGGRFPDLTPIVYFAVFGFACAAAAVIILTAWGGYHVFAALSMYIGAAH